MIKEVPFISVWDSEHKIITDCLVDTNTKEVFSIGTMNNSNYKTHNEEYIMIDNKNYPVYPSNKIFEKNNKYWRVV